MEGGEAPKGQEPIPVQEPALGKQNAEMESSGKSFLDEKIQKLNEEFEGKTGDKSKLEEVFPNAPERKLYLADHSEVLTKGNLVQSNPLLVEHNGRMIEIRSIEIGQDGKYICELEGVEGAVELPKDVVKNAQIVSEAKDIVSLFSGEEREAVSEYIKTLPNGENVSYEDAAKTVEQKQEVKKSADTIIGEQLSQLERQLDSINKEGRTPTKEQQELAYFLRLAKEAKGNVGVLYKEKALERLRENGALDADAALEDIKEKVLAARDRLAEHLQGQSWSQDKIKEFFDALDKEHLESIIKEGRFPKVEGLDVLFFGREMTDEELKKLLDPEDKKDWKGNSLIIALLILALGSLELAKQAVQIQSH